ncbi:hypothetical protein RF11_05058 [Thelohanellus kitauei]|uniref:Uncharacterized protein n=1 Tax=Thelohanellus kitauei TaxID=669202 RepID=A0A0C2NDH8_THEKT|nr:hypothetical protein RF11_05058 [Thelohanellus kitauei]
MKYSGRKYLHDSIIKLHISEFASFHLFGITRIQALNISVDEIIYKQKIDIYIDTIDDLTLKDECIKSTIFQFDSCTNYYSNLREIFLIEDRSEHSLYSNTIGSFKSADPSTLYKKRVLLQTRLLFAVRVSDPSKIEYLWHILSNKEYLEEFADEKYINISQPTDIHFIINLASIGPPLYELIRKERFFDGMEYIREA